jgi:hypothetical protein
MHHKRADIEARPKTLQNYYQCCCREKTSMMMIGLKGDNETFKIVAERNSALFRTHDSNEAFYSNQNDQQKNLTKEKKILKFRSPLL